MAGRHLPLSHGPHRPSPVRSGQMCAALGHNHPIIIAAIRDGYDTTIHADSSHCNVKEIELAARLGRLMPEPLQKKAHSANLARTPTRWR